MVKLASLAAQYQIGWNSLAVYIQSELRSYKIDRKQWGYSQWLTHVEFAVENWVVCVAGKKHFEGVRFVVPKGNPSHVEITGQICDFGLQLCECWNKTSLLLSDEQSAWYQLTQNIT